MAIDIQETFRVAAPVDAVWQFIMSPQNVVACMPGASLTRVVDDRSFVGAVKLKVGAVSAQYQGNITYQEVDLERRLVKMLAEGNERGGGTVSGTITTQLLALPDGAGTEVRCQSSLDLTGRMMQVGRGMIEGVSAQIIKKYVTNMRATLELPAPLVIQAEGTPAAAGVSSVGAESMAFTPPPRVPADDSINILAIVLKVMRQRIAAFFRRLFGHA